MTDFTSGLSSANDYLNRTVSIPNSIDIGPAGAIIKGETSFSLRELICSLLAGNGIKLPNLQICLKANIAGLLAEIGININGALAKLQGALNKVQAALDSFIAHTNIENIIGRLNDAIAEFAAIANMINFCGTPIMPRAIPNVLGDLFGSFTGAGQNVLDQLGTIANSDIGGCISLPGAGGSSGASFSAGIFTGGTLGDIADLMKQPDGSYSIQGLINAPQSVLDGFADQMDAFANDMQNLIEFENNFKGTEPDSTTGETGNGGSVFSPVDRIHTGIGVAIDPSTMTLAQAQRLGAGLQAAFNQLEPYEVDASGKSIFDYILEPELISKLRNQTDPEIQGVTRVATYDYCGRVTGYTDVPDAATSAVSAGSPVEPSAQPAATAIATTGTVVNTPSNATTNLTNPNPIAQEDIPSSPIGKAGDKKGAIATDGEHMYIATADYDGVTNIWKRASLGTW